MNIGIIHYRIGKTDGVSLEIEKRKKVLEEMGHSVKLIAGPINIGADYEIEGFDFDSPEMVAMKNEAFVNSVIDEDLFMDDVYKVAAKYTEALNRINETEKFDYFFAHNIFSLGSNLPSAKGVHDFLIQNKIPATFFHHDFYFEKTHYNYLNQRVNEYIEKYLPPKNSLFTHLTINTISRDRLEQKSHIKSACIADVFDFTQPLWVKDEYNQSFLKDLGIKENDLVVTQATRIVKRKGFELAFEIIEEMLKQFEKLRGHKLYNGKVIDHTSELVFVVAGYPEESEVPYFNELQRIAESKKLPVKFVHERIESVRGVNVQGEKIYSLWDSYVFTDVVLYPSMHEGWGNQLIEAVFAKKPVVINKYEVYKTDVKKEGYRLFEIGDTTVQDELHKFVSIEYVEVVKCVTECFDAIKNQNLNFDLERNFMLGKKFHDLSVFKDYFQKLFNHLPSTNKTGVGQMKDLYLDQ